MIRAEEIACAQTARELADFLDLQIYIRWLYGEKLSPEVDLKDVILHVHQIDRPWPTLVQQVNVAWLAVKTADVLKKCRGSCSEYMKAGDGSGVVNPILGLACLLFPLTLCAMRILLGHRFIPLRWSVTPIARHLNQ